MKNHYCWKDKDIAQLTGNSPDSVRKVVNSKTQDFPRWLKLAIVVFEIENNLKEFPILL
ncbi:MAG: hypothetical protein LCH91_14245 [Bacteroidetes bacterium]|nr:hypothetical protein [Bacteroidota bacterium]